MESRKVLVVDDEPHLRLFIKAVFETSGFTAKTARNGGEGLIKAREMRPDLISLDLMMPGEGGLKMYRALKSDPVLCRTPVLIVSAVKPETFAHALKTLRAGLGDSLPGPEEYLEKPPTPDLLLEAAARLLAATSPDANSA